MNQESELDEFAPWMVLILTGIGGFLRVLLLANKGMWLDETFSVWVASHSIAEMLRLTVQLDQHPPLYYLLLHYWIAFKGDNAYYARLLSVVFGTATIPVIYLIGRRLSGVVMGLAAAVFLAFSTFNIYYAQEARMYTLLTFNAAVAIYALVRLLTDPRSVQPIGSQFREMLHAWRTGQVQSETQEEFSYEDQIRLQRGWRGWIYSHRFPLQSIETDLAWVTLVLFTVATLLSHNTAVFFLLAINIYILGLMLYQRNRKPGPAPAFQAPSLGNWVKAQVAVLVLWSVWIIPLLRQAVRVYREFWIPKPGWDSVTQTLRNLLNPSAPGQISQAIVMVILCIILFLGLVYYRKRLSIFVFLATLFAVPFLGELLVSLRRPIFYDRTLIWITIPMFLLLAAGVTQLRFRFAILIVVGILATNNLFSTGDYYRFWQKEDWSTPAGYVANFAEQGDLVLFNDAFVQIPFDYYFKPYEDQYSIQVEKHGVPGDMLAVGNMEPKMTESDIPGLISMLSGHKRVWLVYSHNSYTDPGWLVPKTLGLQMKLTRERDFYGGKVQLYETP